MLMLEMMTLATEVSVHAMIADEKMKREEIVVEKG
jgi:hypothetical protein